MQLFSRKWTRSPIPFTDPIQSVVFGSRLRPVGGSASDGAGASHFLSASQAKAGAIEARRVSPKQEKDRPPRPRPPKPQARVKPRPSGHRAKSSKAWSAWRKLPERQQRSASPVGRARESLCSFLSSVVLLRPPSPPSLQPPRPPQPPNPCGRGCMRKQSRGEATHLSEANALLPRCPHCRSRRRECKRPLRARHR